MRRFNSIKKSRKKSKDIDEKIEYLNKECHKTGLNEIMTTSNVYVGTEDIPNTTYTDFESITVGGYPLGLSAADGNVAGGAINGDFLYSTGVALSPPHPVTGQRYTHYHVTDGTGGGTQLRPGQGMRRGFGNNRPLYTMGSALWFYDANHNNGVGNPPGRWFSFEYFNNNWGFWDTIKPPSTLAGFYIFNTNLSEYPGSGGLGAEIASKISGINFSINGEIGPPTTTIFIKNDLGDPSFLPINIDKISPQAFDYLKGNANLDAAKAAYYAAGGQMPWHYLDPRDKEIWLDKFNQGTEVASDVNYDVYNYLLDNVPDKSGEAASWYENNPTLPHTSNPFIPPRLAPYIPLASNPNNQEPVSDINLNTGLGAQPGDQLAFNFGGGKSEPKPITKKSDLGPIQKQTAAKDAYFSINGMGLSPQAFEKKYGISPQDFLNLPESKTSNKKYFEEGVKLGHFDPEILNVDINDIRKGIMPEFPKDPPPEMINGYSAKSRLVPKKVELPHYIKVTKKDLARNHKLTDKEKQDFLNDVNRINEYIRKNPDELKYAIIRYPKDDPRLAQLNFKMDQMKAAGDEYMDTHFPENETLFKKLQNKIRDNIEKTDPRRIDTSVPIVSQEEALLAKKRRLSVLERFKKQVNVKPFFDRKTPEIDWKIDYLNRELEKTGFSEMMTTTDMYTVVDTVPTTPAEFGEVPDPDPANGITSNNWQQPLGVDPNGNPASAPPTSFPRIWDNPGYLDPTEGLLNKDNLKGDGTDTPIYNTDDLTWQDPSEIPSGAVGGVQIEVGGMDPGIVGGYLDANGFTRTTGQNIRLGSPNFKTHPDLFKPVKYWHPFSIFHPFIDAYFPGLGNTPEYSGIVMANPARALFTAYVYVGGGRNTYETKPNHLGYTIPLSRDDLGDPNFLPIDVRRFGFSPEAYEYLKNAAGLDIASGEPDLDTYDWYLKTYPNSGAAQWYYNNPNSHPKNNPFLSPSDYVPFTDTAYNPNDSGYSDVVSDVDVNIGLGAQPGDQLAFFGGGNNNNKPPSPPTSRTNKGTLDATKASTGMYPNMTPEIFFQKYGITPNQYLNLP